MPAAPNFNVSADWMTQYTYLPRPSTGPLCSASLFRPDAFSRTTFAGTAFDAAGRGIARRSFSALFDALDGALDFLAIGGCPFGKVYTPRRRRAAGSRAMPESSARNASFSAESSSYGRDSSAGRATGTDC